VGRHLPSEVGAVLAQVRPDVVHCHGFMFPEIAYWAIRASSSANVVSLMSAGFPTGRLAARLFRAAFSGQIARVGAVIALSDWAAECHAGFFREPYAIIPPGIDLVRFSPDLSDRGAPRVPTVLFVGRLDERKGLEVLLRAMPIVLQERPDARLAIVGDGPRRASAERLSEELGIGGRVAFMGRVSREELPHVYASASLYVSPALGGESFGIVLLEAMASGVPVIASDIRGYDEVVASDVGVRVPPGDPHALGHAIRRVLSDTREADRLAAAGLRRAASYAWPRIAELTLQVYARTLSSTSS
jgi:phosphatidylinositol alpha-mannosyltransferase